MLIEGNLKELSLPSIIQLNCTEMNTAKVSLTYQGKEGLICFAEGAITHALQQAEIAAAHGIRVFAVSVGSAADQALMAQIAEIGHGRHLHAGGSVEQYSSDLIDIFQELGSERTVQLIQ